MWYSIIKRYYNNGHPAYNAESVRVFVSAQYITEDQYKLITGIEYTTE